MKKSMDSNNVNTQNAVLLDHKVYKILQKCCDAPVVFFFTSPTEPLLWQKERTSQKREKVILVCTEYYTYLIKRHDYKYVTRWPNRMLSLNVQQTTMVFSCAMDISKTPFTFSAAESSSSSSKKKKDLTSDLLGATLLANSLEEARRIECGVSKLITSAGRAAAMLEREEAGGGAGGIPGGANVGGVDGGAGGRPLDSSGSDADESMGGGETAAGLLLGDGAALVDGQRGNKLEELLRLAPARYIALTSLVDGEFADYTTLRNAYLRNDEEQLMNDLEVFIRENESRVEALCQAHYAAFINAAEQCLNISPQDAQTVGEHLATANTMVKAAVVDIKQAAEDILTLRTTCGNLDATRDLLQRSLSVVEYLETAESQVAKMKLRGAVISLRELVRLAAPLAEFDLGEYVLHRRVPALTRQVLTCAVQQLNIWLNRLRQEALSIGTAAFEWRGACLPGRIEKEVVFAPQGDWWWLSETFVPSEMTLAPFAVADTVLCLCNGAGIQVVFEELRRGEDFRRYYCEGRTQQAEVDFYNATCRAYDLTPEQLVEDFERFCRSALGFILIEDMVHTATSPQVQSCSEILRTWDRLATAISSRLTVVSNALASDPQYSVYMLRIVDTMRSLLRHSMESVKSVELSPVILLKVIESYTDNLVSAWLVEACAQLTATVVADPLLALIAENERDFELYVLRFHVHRSTSLELSIPTSFSGKPVTLPYGEMVPKVGVAALEFLHKCHTVMVMDTSSAVRHSELNNVDEMILKYLSVLFRTVAEAMRQLGASGAQSVLKCATFVSSCAVMPVIVSCIEQEFLLRWSSDAALNKQKLGSPQLLKASADLFSRPLQEGMEKMLSACITDVKTHLALSATITYWYKQLDLRQANEDQRAAEECFQKCITYVLQLIPQLAALLPGSVVRSVIGTALAHVGQAIQSSIDTALRRAFAGSDHNFNAMRACVAEFEMQCSNGVPRWQQQLRAALPGLTASERFPLDARGAANSARAWIESREAEVAREKANQPQLVTAMEDAGKAFSRSVQAIGKSVVSFKKKDSSSAAHGGKE